jgi:hypothetical protein
LKTGKLLKDKIYLIHKNPNGPNTDFGYTAPAGERIEWEGKTNQESLDSYGGKLFHWITIRGHVCGAELGVDFEFDPEPILNEADVQAVTEVFTERVENSPLEKLSERDQYKRLLLTARDLAERDFALSVPPIAKEVIRDLLRELAAREAMLDEIRTVPQWKDPVSGQGGYDVDGDEWAIIDGIVHGHPHKALQQLLDGARMGVLAEAEHAVAMSADYPVYESPIKNAIEAIRRIK